MHCKNCGAQYRARDLACPYCGTENLVGRIWMSQVTEAEIEYEMARIEAGKGLPLYVINRVLNRVLLLSTGMVFMIFAVIMIVSTINLGKISLERKLNAEEIAAQSQQLYEEGRLGELYALLDEYDMFDENSNYIYSQAAMLGDDYANFRYQRMEFLSMTEEKKEEDDWLLQSSIRTGLRVIRHEAGIYNELDPANEKLHEEMADDVMGYFLGELGITSEELQPLLDAQYLFYADSDELAAIVRERGAWR